MALGKRYISFEALVADLDIAGFDRTGYFVKHEPMTMTENTADIGDPLKIKY